MFTYTRTLVKYLVQVALVQVWRKRGWCKHVVALLRQILDYIQLKLNEVPDDLTCTQLSQQWHVPNTKEKLDTAVLFDQVITSRPTSKTEKHYITDYNNPAPQKTSGWFENY